MTPEHARAIVADAIASSDDGTLSGPDLLRAAPVLIAELDSLRALPVIATCGDCGWARDGGHSYDGPLVVCGKITHNSLGWRQAMSVADEPPMWCPLRGGGR